MTLWRFCLGNNNMATEVKSRIAGVKKQMEKFDFFYGISIASTDIPITYRKLSKPKKCPPAPAKGLLN